MAQPVPAALLRDDALPPGAKLVALALVNEWAWSKPECWPSDPTIAEALGMSPGHVQRCLAALERRGWIERRQEGRKRLIRLRWRAINRAEARPPTAPARGQPPAPARSERIEVEIKKRNESDAIPTSTSTSTPTPRATPTTMADEVETPSLDPPTPILRPPDPPPAPSTRQPVGAPSEAAIRGRLSPGETQRFEAASASARDRIVRFLGSGDPILEAEARRLLRPPPPPGPRPEELDDEALIQALPGRVELVGATASRLSALLKDPNGFQTYHKRAYEVATGRVGPSVLAEAVKDARNGRWRKGPGVGFSVTWRNLTARNAASVESVTARGRFGTVFSHT